MNKGSKWLCIACLSLLFISCHQKESEETRNLPEKEKIKALLVTDSSGIGDHSFNSASFSGLLSYYGDTFDEQKYRGTLYEVSRCTTEETALEQMEKASILRKYDIIIMPGLSYAQSLITAALHYPDQKFMIIDTDQISLPNVLEISFSEEQGSFLVGAAAALQSRLEGRKNPKFGFIGGEISSVITKFQIGFIQGVLSVIPGTSVEEYYTGSWERMDLAEQKSMEWFASGVYAVYSAAGASGLGTIEAAKYFRQKGYNVWALGVDSDQFDEGLYAKNKSAVLTSMIKDAGRAVVYTLNMMEAGNFVSGSVVFDLAAEGVSYTKTNNDLSAEVIVSLEKLKKTILEGKRKVYSSYSEALEAGAVQELKHAVK